MADERIIMPEPVNRCSFRVLYGDTDSGGVVYYANYLRYFELGRSEYMRQYVESYRALEERGFIMPVVKCFVRFKASAFYDDLIIISTSLVEVKKKSCRFNNKIHRKEGGKLLVKGYTLHATVDRSGKLAALPDDLMNRLKAVLDYPVNVSL